MAWFAGALGVALVAAVGAIAGLVRYFGENAREINRQLGEARGEIERLRGIVSDRERQLEALRVALDHALSPRPTLDELARVSREAAGGDPASDAAASIHLP